MPLILSHVDLRVRDRAKATEFYDALLNVLGAVKDVGKTFTTWQIPYSSRVRQTDFEDVRSNPKITNPAGGPFAPSGPVANCPIVSIDGKSARAPQ